MDFDNFVCCLVRLETMFRECPILLPFSSSISHSSPTSWWEGRPQAHAMARARDARVSGVGRPAGLVPGPWGGRELWRGPQAAGRAAARLQQGHIGMLWGGGGEAGRGWSWPCVNVPLSSQPTSSFLEHTGFFKTLDTDLDGVVTFDLFKVGPPLAGG